MMTTTIHTNISSTSVDGITVLRMLMVDTGAGWGSGRDAEGLVLLPTGVIVPEIQVGSYYKGQRWKYDRCIGYLCQKVG